MGISCNFLVLNL